MGRAAGFFLLKIKYTQPAFAACQTQLTTPSFPGKNIIINHHDKISKALLSRKPADLNEAAWLLPCRV
jgi:hypothetical protein